MAIKNPSILTREDYNQAQVTLGLTYADLAKEVGLPRQYLSEFRAGTRNLVPEHQRKLRNYFEDNGIVFEDSDLPKQGESLDNGAPTKPPGDDQDATDLKASPALRSTAIACLHFAISPNIPASDLMKIIRQMEENETRLEELLGKEVKEAGFLSLGKKWDDETEADMQEVFGLMASNFVLSSLVQGKSFVYRETEEGEDAKTVRDMMNDTFFGAAFTGVIADWVNSRPDTRQSPPDDAATIAKAPKIKEEA